MPDKVIATPNETAAESPAEMKRIDEFELPETVFVRDIENRVFQAIVLRCLAKIEGIRLLEGNFMDSILGRDSFEGVRGIHAEQNSKDHTVTVKVEVNVCYGIPIPEKAEEVQSKVTEEITALTGLHVSRVHVVIKGVILADPSEKMLPGTEDKPPALVADQLEDEYSEDF